MPDFRLLLDLLLVLGSAFIGGFIVRKLKQPIILGYLIAGLSVSGLAETFGLDRKGLSILSEFGLALLLFTLGLEFSLNKIKSLKKVVGVGSILQIVLTIAIGTFFLKTFFGYNFSASFIMASAFSLSSTAIVIKLLAEKAGLESLPGEIMVGWLLVQDLAVLPLISLIGILFANVGFEQNVIKLTFSISVLAITLFVANRVISKFSDLVDSLRSRELLLLFVIALVFVMASLTSSLGFSFGLGAFLAGLILSQASSHFAILSEIRPFRDVFLAIFFVSLGLSLEPNFLVINIGKILEVSLLVLVLKVVIVAIILAIYKYHAKTILECCFGLSQVGEFSFVLAASALAGGFLGKQDYFTIASVTLLTMVITPWLFNLSKFLYQKLSLIAPKFPKIYGRFFAVGDKKLFFEELSLADHVVIIGYGRVGKWIGEALKKANVPFLVIEYDPKIVRLLKLEENSVIFGDPADINVLDFAQVNKAKAVVLAIPDDLTQKMVISNCKFLNPRIRIICRSHAQDIHDLRARGVQHIIQPEFEAALSITHRVLQEMGFEQGEINSRLKEIKKEHEQ